MPTIRHMLGLITLTLLLGRAAFAIDIVVLSSGETLRGEIIEQADEHIVLRHTILGDLTIARNSIDSMLLGVVEEAAKDAVQQSPDPAPEAAPEPPADLPPAEPKKAKQWKSHVDVGASANAGNTEDTNLRFALKSIWTRPHNIITFDTSFNYATSGGDETENNITAGVLSDWPQADTRWGFFGQGRYDHDEFNSWTDRVSGGGGISYRLYDVDEPIPGTDERRIFQVKLRAGLGATREWGSMNTDIQPEAILGADLILKLNARQDLVAGTTVYPNLGDVGEYRVVSNIEWVLKIDQLDGISFKLGAAHEYQSRTDGAIKHNDLSVYAALGFDF